MPNRSEGMRAFTRVARLTTRKGFPYGLVRSSVVFVEIGEIKVSGQFSISKQALDREFDIEFCRELREIAVYFQ
jgi:hypothetical protein